MATFRTRNPATGQLTYEADATSDEQLEGALERAEEGFRRHRHTSYREREEALLEIADRLEAEVDRWANLVTTEMGKPLSSARSEIEKCAWLCRYLAEHGRSFLDEEPVETDAHRSYVTYQPLGPVLAVMPWNFPFWQVFRFGAPALLAGNTALLKHAPNVPQCAEAIEALFQDAFDRSCFQNLFVDTETVGSIIDDPRVRAVTLTGSVNAGRAVAERAGRAVKKTVLELGGSDPFLVLGDADLERALDVGVRSRMLNSGQSCIAAKRFITVDAIADEFRSGLVDRVRALTVSDPTEPDTDVGPLARRDLRDRLHDQVRRSREAGATVELGGEKIDGPGTYYEPTVLTGVEPGMAAFEEELFGPVAAFIRASSEEEAVRLANQSSYGLGAAVFTQDRERGEEIALELKAGAAFVNGLVKSDPRLPFGGIKQSGYGRELARWGMREFTNVKTVWIG